MRTQISHIAAQGTASWARQRSAYGCHPSGYFLHEVNAMRWIDRFLSTAFVIAALAFVPHARVLAQAQPAAGTRTDFEFQRMVEVVQEARDYVQRRRDALGGLPSDVQQLVTAAQQLLAQLQQAVAQRDLPTARGIFDQALGLFDEIRARLNDAISAQDPTLNTPQQLAAKLAQAIKGLRNRLGELRAAAGQNPPSAIATELTRIDGLVRALETPPAGATQATLRAQVADARKAIVALEAQVAEQAVTTP